MRASRAQVLARRVRVQQLDGSATSPSDAAVLDLGVQDSRPDGVGWALANRGVPSYDPHELVLLWTLRGAPHAYRRSDLPSVLRAVAPFSDADAYKRVYDAAKPLKAAGVGGLAALDEVAAAMREVLDVPRPKGEVSGELSRRLPAHHLRACVPCGTTHVWEMTFRLAAVRAGVELQPGTSPPVLQRLPDVEPAPAPEPRHDVVRAYLRLLGPATQQQVAQFLDAPVTEVVERWPPDAVELDVDGQRCWLLEQDVPELDAGPVRGLRLLGPFDLLLQGRDRDRLVDDPARAKRLWPTLGRPGAVLLDGEVAGLWRPRAKGRRLDLQVESWVPRLPGLADELARLAAFRGQLPGEVQPA